ncbi:MAG: lytic transglycosylase domain-containing protein [Hyphomicrobiales bacterium]|nr:lytic transglycosylase domain-containing protein [Hyphomicrobiales bacterium]
MKSVRVWLRAGAVLGMFAGTIPFTTFSSHAEDAAAFFRKDKANWSASAPATASGPSSGTAKSGRVAQSQARTSRKAARRSSSRSGVTLRGSRARFAAAARREGVPVRLALAVIATESRGNCRAVGRRGELGPLQIKPRTARGLGYRGPASALRSCGAGLYWGMKHLALSYRKCGSAVLHNKGLAGSCRRTAYSVKVMRLASRM